MEKYVVKYRTNNSGGSWWLSDEDWKKLEEAGWKVDWVHKSGSFYNKFSDGNRYMGAPAVAAEFEVTSDLSPRTVFKDVIRVFEDALQVDVTEEGCNCCGPPHGFSVYRIDGEKEIYVDGGGGNDLVSVLYDNAPMSLREAARLLNEKRRR